VGHGGGLVVGRIGVERLIIGRSMRRAAVRSRNNLRQVDSHGVRCKASTARCVCLTHDKFQPDRPLIRIDRAG
jgi:hypothetical protein